MTLLNQLFKYQEEIANLQYTINILEWELRVVAPKGSQDELINLISYYETKLFNCLTKDSYGKLLYKIYSASLFYKLSEPEQRYIKNLLRKYEESIKIPKDFYARYITLKSKSNIVWQEAKRTSNYDLFKPYLEKIITMTKRYYRFIDSDNPNLYDVMLNHYETGMTSEIIDKLFGKLKEKILPIMPTKQNNLTLPELKVDTQDLLNCANFLLDYIGFDLNRGTIGIYPHGFTSKISANDIRIAFKYTKSISFVSTIIHEGGHGIFEQNISKKLSRYENTMVDYLYALHESQSRFYENILGRNINFWIPIYDKVKEILHLEIPLEKFISLLNNSNPNLIRTESDELTYCMHIILRYEIERDIFNGNLSVDDIPDVWNKKVKEYFNLTVDSSTNGVLQDIHWSDGDFGYFPSYLLGNIYDGMLLQAIERDLGNINDILKNGQIKEITKYLVEKIYKNGGAYTSLEIIERLCHTEISVDPIVSYFEKKYKKK